jgi:hypothetical protein
VRELLSTPYFRLTVEPDSRLVRFVRSDTPYPSNEEIVRAHEEASEAIDRFGRAGSRLLVDMRDAQINNQPGFEHAAGRGRTLLVRGFDRVAVVVRTAIGELQVRRHVREDRLDVGVFQDEPAAERWLMSSTAVAWQGTRRSG